MSELVEWLKFLNCWQDVFSWLKHRNYNIRLQHFHFKIIPLNTDTQTYAHTFLTCGTPLHWWLPPRLNAFSCFTAFDVHHFQMLVPKFTNFLKFMAVQNKFTITIYSIRIKKKRALSFSLVPHSAYLIINFLPYNSKNVRSIFSEWEIKIISLPF